MRPSKLILILIVGLLCAPVQAQMVEEESFREQIRLLNESADWQLFSHALDGDIELYYDASKINHTSKSSVVVSVKTIFKSSRAVAAAKRVRENVKIQGIHADASNYEQLASSIEFFEIYCPRKRISERDIKADLDREGNILTLRPSGPSGFNPILANSPLEKLYKIICPQEVVGAIYKTSKEISSGTATHASSGTYNDPLSGIEFLFVKGGCFDMGDISEDRLNIEETPHQVCVDDFFIGKHEVTQGQWRKVMGSEPIHFMDCGDDCPAVFVSWEMAQEFITKLNKQPNVHYRLPTASEWEYAARSGGKIQKYAGTDNESEINYYAWYSANSNGQPHPVGQKRPNGLGLYDMSGNVWEWVDDYWYEVSNDKNIPKEDIPQPSTSKLRQMRGGDYQCSPKGIRATNSAGATPVRRDSSTGFRLVLQSQDSMDVNQ